MLNDTLSLGWNYVRYKDIVIINSRLYWVTRVNYEIWTVEVKSGFEINLVRK